MFFGILLLVRGEKVNRVKLWDRIDGVLMLVIILQRLRIGPVVETQIAKNDLGRIHRRNLLYISKKVVFAFGAYIGNVDQEHLLHKCMMVPEYKAKGWVVQNCDWWDEEILRKLKGLKNRLCWGC